MQRVTLIKEDVEKVVKNVSTFKEAIKILHTYPRLLKRSIKEYNISTDHFLLKRTGKGAKIIELIKQGKNNNEIVEMGYARNSSYVSKLREKYELQVSPVLYNMRNVNWDEIQKYYNEGNSIADTAVRFKISPSCLFYNSKINKFKTRTNKEAQKFRKRLELSDEHKQKIREFRIKYMQENPEKTAWFRRHRHEKSFPEKVFETKLQENDINGWEYNLRIGIYQCDFGFLNNKLDVEIDGAWHLSEKQKFKDSLRDKYFIENGWKVLRFTAKEILDDSNKCIEVLRQHINCPMI